jgi:hypothetical protein
MPVVAKATRMKCHPAADVGGLGRIVEGWMAKRGTRDLCELLEDLSEKTHTQTYNTHIEVQHHE